MSMSDTVWLTEDRLHDAADALSQEADELANHLGMALEGRESAPLDVLETRFEDAVRRLRLEARQARDQLSAGEAR